MPILPPSLSVIAVLVLATVLYVAIWYATRSLDAGARVLARTTPAAVIVPGLLYISAMLATQREEAEAEPAALPRTSRPAAIREGTASGHGLRRN
jgi:hypothetical protein